MEAELVFLHVSDVLLQDAQQRPQLTLQGNDDETLTAENHRESHTAGFDWTPNTLDRLSLISTFNVFSGLKHKNIKLQDITAAV